MVPVLTHYANLAQHAAVGTSSAAVVMTASTGALAFASAGAVDWNAAATLAVAAMVGARFGARFTSSFSSAQLARTFAIFQLCVAPIVPIKGELARRAKRGADEGDAAGADVQPRKRNYAALVGVGLFAGISSGMFGIGGGLIITPTLCLTTDMDYKQILGTNLASMVPPAVVGAVTHYGLGNLVMAAAPALCLGAAIGGTAGGQLAQRLPEEPLQLIFAVLLSAMGARKLVALRAAK